MSNTYSKTYLHYVFSPRYRKALIRPEFEEKVYKYITGIVTNLNQYLIRINGMPDHCYLWARLRPAMAPAKFIQQVRANSSGWIKQQGFLKHKFRWQRGEVSGYLHVDRVMNYIDDPKNHHRGAKFREGYLQMLDEPGTDDSEDYLLNFFD